MHDVHTRAIDLNLLVVLRALIEERGVTRAADRLGMTQSAVSHALGRLRRALSDPLLVRSPRGMDLTPRAQAMAEPLARALDSLGSAVAGPSSFDPRASTRRFRIATDDYLERLLLPALLVRIWQEGPGIDISTATSGAHSGHDLARGDVDAVLAPSGVIGRLPGAYTQHLFDEAFVCLARAGHPGIGRRLTLARFLALPHLLVTPGGRPGGVVDTALAKRGLRRRVAIQIPHFLAALPIVRESPVIVTIGRRLALSAGDEFRIHKPPLELPGFDVSLFWHERDHGDAAHIWLRRVIAAVARSI